MRLLLAGGGTGGHLFPAVALAEQLRLEDPDSAVLFVGTERGLEKQIVPQNNYKLELIEVSGLKRVGWWRTILGLFRLPWALWQSLRILQRFKPDVVLGVGGYASGPVVLAAKMSGVLTAVQEQNAMPGFTNRLLGRLVEVVFTAFPEAGRFFPRRKVQMLGNPIRRSLLDNYLQNSVLHDEFNLLVFGGSQG